MKNFVSFIIVGLFLFTGLQTLKSDKIPVEGGWSKTGLRSSVPAPPEVSIEGNTVSIYFPDALVNLAVYIMDVNGVVYQTTISSNGNDYTCDLPWIGQSGNYRIFLVHGYGTLEGSFTIE